MTPLGYLCQYFIDAQAALVLVESGADPNSQTPNGENTPHAICGASCSSDVLVALLKKGADACARTSYGATGTSLHYAAKRRKSEAVRLLMEHDVLISAIDDKTQTPHCVCRDASDTKSDIEVVQLLLADGACVTGQ